MSTSVAERLTAILIDVLMLEDPTCVRPEAHLIHDLGAESINVAEIIVAIEHEFGVSVPDNVIQQASTVSALQATIEDLLSKA